MDKEIIVGGGFTALIAKIYFVDALLLTLKDNAHDYINDSLMRRKTLELNKFFSPKAISIGALRFSPKINLHDRVRLGGNSEIWGGFVNIELLSGTVLKRLMASRISIQALAYDTNNAYSNSKYAQFESYSNTRLNAADYLTPDISGYLSKIESVNAYPRLHYKQPKSSKYQGSVINYIDCEKVLLCIGVVQILDLLHASSILKNGDVIELDEFMISYSFGFQSESKNCINYNFFGVMLHLLGVKRKIQTPLFISRFLPKLRQKFTYKKTALELIFSDGNIVPTVNSRKFGRSIHYCNLRINGQAINEYISKYVDKVYFFGMAALQQEEPGPISNDIINQIAKFYEAKKQN